MPTDTDAAHRSLHDSRPEQVTLRDAEEVDAGEGMMEIRLPIASTGEVRNAGDDPLTRSELQGMAEQVDSLTRGVFLEHGTSNMVDSAQYGPTEKMGYWADAEIDRKASDDGEDVLRATARMPDPSTLPSGAREYKQALVILKEQAKRNIPISASIGWRTDDAYPGGVDLMEISIVGIGADPRTNSGMADAPVEVLSRAAVDAGADPQEFVDAVAETLRDADALPDDARPFGPPYDPNRWEDFDACVAEVSDWEGVDDPEAMCGHFKDQSEQSADGDGDSRATYEVGEETIDITPPESMVNAAREGLNAKERYSDELGDCGTGVGEDRAEQIINDEVGPDVVDEVAAYLTSHEEDVQGYDEPPTDWGEAQWLGTTGDDTDPRCGPVQYALWGGLSTGTALNWAQRKANDVADARGEEIPYPDRASESPDDTNTMTETDDPGDDEAGTDTESEQTADDGETETRAPDDLTEERLATFTAAHFDGMDESDLMQAADAADGEFIGECDEEELIDLVSLVTGAEYDDVADAMGALMESAQEYEDGEKVDEDDEDDDEEMNAQSESEADGESDEERAADTDADDGDDGADGEDEDMAARVAELEDELQTLRSEGLDVNRSEETTEDEYDGESRDADDGDDATETTNEDAGLDLRQTNIPE